MENSGVDHNVLGMISSYANHLENFTGGKSYVDFRGDGKVKMPVNYNAQGTPPFVESMAIANALGLQPTASIQVTDQDRSELKKKQDLIDYADYEKIVMDLCKPGQSPASLAWFQENHPEIWNHIKGFASAQFDLAKEVHMLGFELPTGPNVAKFMALSRNPQVQDVIKAPGGIKTFVTLPTDADVLKAVSGGHENPSFKKGFMSELSNRKKYQLASIGTMYRQPMSEGGILGSAAISVAHKPKNDLTAGASSLAGYLVGGESTGLKMNYYQGVKKEVDLIADPTKPPDATWMAQMMGTTAWA